MGPLAGAAKPVLCSDRTVTLRTGRGGGGGGRRGGSISEQKVGSERLPTWPWPWGAPVLRPGAAQAWRAAGGWSLSPCPGAGQSSRLGRRTRGTSPTAQPRPRSCAGGDRKGTCVSVGGGCGPCPLTYRQALQGGHLPGVLCPQCGLAPRQGAPAWWGLCTRVSGPGVGWGASVLGSEWDRDPTWLCR